MDDRPDGQSSFDSTFEAPPEAGSLPAEDTRFPWPPGPREPVFEALAETLQRSLFRPSQFFRAMSADVPLGATLIYYLLISVLAAGIALFWGALFSLFVSSGGPVAVLLGAGGGDWGGRVVSFLLSPLWLTVVLFVVTAVIHVALVVLGGARRGFGGSVRALAYSVGPQILVIVPVIGGFAGAIWATVLSVIGLREVHGTSTGRALAAVFLPLLLLLIPIVFLLFLAVGLLML